MTDGRNYTRSKVWNMLCRSMTASSEILVIEFTSILRNMVLIADGLAGFRGEIHKAHHEVETANHLHQCRKLVRCPWVTFRIRAEGMR